MGNRWMPQRERAQGLFGDDDLARVLDTIKLISRRRDLPRGGGSGTGHLKGGLGMDFAEFVPYAQGMDLRRLDPRVSLRARFPMVRTSLDEAELPVTVLLDGSGSMALGEPSKGVAAARIGACMAWGALAGGHPVQIYACSRGGHSHFPMVRGVSSFWTLTKYLNTLQMGGTGDLHGLLTGIPDGAGAGRGRIYLISDMLFPNTREVLELMAAMGGHRLEAMVVCVKYPGEETPGGGGWSSRLSPGTLVRPVDPEQAEETGASSMGGRGASRNEPFLWSDRWVHEYEANFLNHHRQVARTCTRLGIHHLQVHTSQPLLEMVVPILAMDSLGLDHPH